MQEAGILYKELEKIEEILKTLQDTTGNEHLEYYIRRLRKEVNSVQFKVVEEAVKEIADTYKSESVKTTAYFKPDFNTEQKDITLTQAKALIKEVEKEADAMGIPVVIAVYNSQAHPVAIHSMDNSYIASFDIAANKAYTCAALKVSTSVLKNLSQPGKELYGIQNTNQGRIVIFGGGEPLLHKENIIGSLGVSGGTEAQDKYLAEFGKEKMEEVLLWQ